MNAPIQLYDGCVMHVRAGHTHSFACCGCGRAHLIAFSRPRAGEFGGEGENVIGLRISSDPDWTPQSSWISLAERKPEENEEVWLFRPAFGNRRAEQAEGWWCSRRDGLIGWTFGGMSYVPDAVPMPAPTHWLPRPAPPDGS